MALKPMLHPLLPQTMNLMDPVQELRKMGKSTFPFPATAHSLEIVFVLPLLLLSVSIFEVYSLLSTEYLGGVYCYSRYTHMAGSAQGIWKYDLTSWS